MSPTFTGALGFFQEETYAVLFVGNSNRNCIAECTIYKYHGVGGAEVSEKELKQVLAGITIVTTMLKLVIQHRGQVQKGKKDV